MKKVFVVAEAQPIDPVIASALIVDGRSAEKRPAGLSRRECRIDTSTSSRDGRRHSVRAQLVTRRLTIDELAREIYRSAALAAEEADLDLDHAAALRASERLARRQLGFLRWFRR